MSARLGAVSYLNTRPLVFALKRDRAPFSLSYSLPSRCAVDLAEGHIDVGLIPSIEYARSPEPYYIAPEVAIASRGEVLTVRLFYLGELAQITKVALDLSSRTSVALVRILLSEKFGLNPLFVDAEPDLDAMLKIADAALLIGDPIFELLDLDCRSLDLGSEWNELTGLPFVFAFWAGREGALGKDEARVLIKAKEEGLGHIGEIAAAYSEERGGDPALYERYLRRHIDCDLDEAALDGLRVFYAKSREHGLIDAVPELRFYPVEDRV